MAKIQAPVTRRNRPLHPVGMYDPAYEHDACGVGFIANLNGERSHDIIHKALEILVRLTHRGAESSDNRTGDGAGLQLQIPHEFYRKVAEQDGFELPGFGQYGTGLVFMPQDDDARKFCTEALEAAVRDNGQTLLAWRTLPVDNSALGRIAGESEPVMLQIFIGRDPAIADDRHFERELFMIRKTAEQAVAKSDLDEVSKDTFYLPTLSSRIIVYKGLLKPEDFENYFLDLLDPDVKTGLALVHQRYSTNTFPAWKLAQPFRFLCHNGEINTLRGNINWMNTRQHQFKSELFGDRIKKLYPICIPGNSDSASLDNTLELLYHTGRDLPLAMMMMVPEAWQNHKTMSDERKAFYEYHSCLMEPWDGPALMPFTDGTFVGAILDRNGLRPARWLVTDDGVCVMASETGVVDIPPEKIVRKGRLQPGRMFLLNMKEGRIVEDEEIKTQLAARQPYRQWLNEHLQNMAKLPEPAVVPEKVGDLKEMQRLFGYTLEDMRIVLKPMVDTAKEALGSMGADIPLAVLSDRPQLVYNYFRQLFAQVTNPPLDAIREELVTSLVANIGHEKDLFQETPEHCRMLRVKHPILRDRDLEKLRALDEPGLKAITLPMFFDTEQKGQGLEDALEALCTAAEQAVDKEHTILILSDRGAARDRTPIPALLATAAVHHHLIRNGKRTRCGLVVETGEAREIHHFCCLIGFGAGAVNPYLAFPTICAMVDDGFTDDVTDHEKAIKNYLKAAGKGLLKVFSKMGVSTLHSYRGAQIFESVGLQSQIVDRYFVGTAGRIEGTDLDGLARDVHRRREHAYPAKKIPENLDIDIGGVYQWRRQGETHLVNPMVVAHLQQAVGIRNQEEYQAYADEINLQNKKLCTLRGMMEFQPSRNAIPLEEVEPWTEIVKRFKTGAMSYGSISREAHETLAVAMNRMGGKSNSGEGGEEQHRYVQDENGDSRSSAIKQVASGRFGVTSHYLVNAQEIQIKMAQGAKPGEGGQLPGFKVNDTIAKARHSTPYVALVSPPPHHDIYSIEDLAQLIFDLKNANMDARINVKLVSEVGVGTVAAGVSKGRADVVLISGWDGGTGASPETSLKHAGLPWELGVAETHQTLVLNDLRSRIAVEADGKLLTGRDVAVACLLGAEEFGFSTGPLISMGCIMMRACHLNTCPVGIATQRKELREKFSGTPEQVINYFYLVAEELREIMASLGYRTIDKMVGESQNLNMKPALDHYKAKGLDFSRILQKPTAARGVGTHKTYLQDFKLESALDNQLLAKCRLALRHAEHVHFSQEIKNVNRTVGTMLSAEISRRYGTEGLPEDTIVIDAHGHGGQSFAAFCTQGLTFHIRGDANDYFGKGLCGARLSIAPPKDAPFEASENIIIGNVAFYGATRGEAYINGMAGERFCVRNSGVHTVVEGIGDHGCEYMTGGRVVVLGRTGRNFAAGMSGGVAYVLDEKGDFAMSRCNHEMVELSDVTDPDDVHELKELIKNHHQHTGSKRAGRILESWEAYLPRFIKILPTDYRLALERLERERKAARRKIHEEALELAVEQD